jgi:hypothetical protein
MFYKRLFEEVNPLLVDDYGGIPSDGGYKKFTEYEVGVSIIAESLHCILGSLGKILKYYVNQGEQIDSGKRTEKQHITEEFNIIQDAIEEYSHDIYLQMLSEDNVYSDKSIRSMLSNSKVLRLKIDSLKKSFLKSTDNTTLPENFITTVLFTYRSLYKLADRLISCINNNKSIFTDTDFLISIESLGRQLKSFYR